MYNSSQSLQQIDFNEGDSVYCSLTSALSQFFTHISCEPFLQIQLSPNNRKRPEKDADHYIENNSTEGI